ncbi:sulfite reductase flavoprotein subunit alpha [Dokdonella sp.]|uniref:sulfite reductase subunit alpha n=1 Tax=Dokdonella sp. TaxID=2291710 RepID=UPI001B0EF0E1|nr:sulfite reductase flavoprotein subunit alpha [Dokdonella sp.]MBO9663215.1 sulfite reductase flavoprotein subunit alpha [Dokdonella sp.]
MTRDSSTARDSSASEWRGAIVPLAVIGVIAFALLQLHGGWPAWSRPGGMRVATAVLMLLAYAGFCATIWRLRRAGDAATQAPGEEADAALLVAYASQTGYAEQLARQTVDSLRAAGVAVRLSSLGQLDAAALARASSALFVVSTTGEGNAPDGVATFVRDVLDQPLELPALRYGVLALGDREYRNFCAFGRRLDAWLRGCGAQPLFDRVEVDDGDDGALRHWQHEIGVVTGRTDLPDWQAPRYEQWHLVDRRLLNPGSVGGGCFHLVLQPPRGATAMWRAGDIAEIGPRQAPDDVAAWLRAAGVDGAASVEGERGRETLGDRLARSGLPDVAACLGQEAASIAAQLVPLPHREYSIASLPADGAIHLLVRQFRRPDGRLGLGAGWLTEHARVGEAIALRIRANANFHAPDPARPLILIGNGTGIAGLRALLKERVAAGARRNWLLFGERQAAHDFHYREDIDAWMSQGWIERLDLAFSRDIEQVPHDSAGATRPAHQKIYVQHRLAAAGERVREWVGEGAAIYVCGSLDGMAPAVDAVLRETLGREAVQELLAQGRYRRDVY